MNLDRLFRPQNVVVYGGKWSDYVLDQCRKLGFPGNLWRVHPSRDGCFRQTTDLPDVPDSTFLGINRDLTLPVLRDLRSMGLGGAVLFASGFGEIEEGHSYRDALDEAAGDLPYIGPNCYGFINFFDRVALWNFYVIPQWHSDEYRIAYRDKFARPDKRPEYDLGFSTWWFDPAKGKGKAN